MSKDNKEIIDKVNKAFAKGKIEDFLSLCMENVEWIIVGERNVKGKDAIREWMASIPLEPPKFTVANVIAEDDFAAAYGDVTMQDKDGKTGPYSYCDIYRFRDGKIAQLTSFVVQTKAKYATSGA